MRFISSANFSSFDISGSAALAPEDLIHRHLLPGHARDQIAELPGIAFAFALALPIPAFDDGEELARRQLPEVVGAEPDAAGGSPATGDAEPLTVVGCAFGSGFSRS
jgi:hypothetical protein